MGKKVPVNIQKPVYSMASADGERAEIVLYGDIYETRPVDLWTDEPVAGEFILLDEFMADLERVSGCREIVLRLNTYGGDAGVSVTIHNRLRELARDGVKLTCVVDGVAMSGGSIIMCACDTVRVNPASLIMIHKCWTLLYGQYNADELRRAADRQDAWDAAQISVYKRKTGLTETVLAHMMRDTTYMTGKEAVEKGFADELIEDAEPLDIAASADGRALYVRGRQYRLAPGLFAPDAIPTVKAGVGEPPVEIETNTPEKAGNDEEENCMTLEELREKHPDLVAQIEADAKAAAEPAQDGEDRAKAAVEAERRRMEEIDALAGLYDAQTVQEAKYGPNASTAQEMTYRAAQKAAAQGRKFLTDLAADAEASGTGEVGAACAPEEGAEPTAPEDRMARARANVHEIFKNEKEDKKNGKTA